MKIKKTKNVKLRYFESGLAHTVLDEPHLQNFVPLSIIFGFYLKFIKKFLSLMDVKFSGNLNESHITQRKRNFSLLSVIFLFLPKMHNIIFCLNGHKILW